MSAEKIISKTAYAEDIAMPATQQEKELQPGALFLNGRPYWSRGDSKGKVSAPVDELTKMPLPVLPPPQIPSRSKPERANWHHHYHPSNSELLSSVAGLAVRHARLQLLPLKTYHDVYHGIFVGPEFLPRTNEERFGHIVLSCVGYVPPEAIDVHSDDPTAPVALTKRMRRRLQTSGELDVRGQANISNFMKDYLVKQDLSVVDESIIEEFLTTKEIEKKRELGHYLLSIASEVAVEPVIPVYQQALEEGLIFDRIRLPNLVKSQINGPKISSRAIKALHKRLTKTRLQTDVNRVQSAY